MKQSFFSFKRCALNLIVLVMAIPIPMHAAESNSKASLAYQKLLQAITFDDPSAVEKALKQGARANYSPNPRTSIAPFNYAAHFHSANNVKILKILLQSGAKVNQKDPHGDTSLMVVAHQGRSEAVKVLLDYGADTTLLDANEKTAAKRARENSHDDIAKMIITAGVKKAQVKQASAAKIDALAQAVQKLQIDSGANDANGTAENCTRKAHPITSDLFKSPGTTPVGSDKDESSDWSNEELSDFDSTIPYPDLDDEDLEIRDAKGRTKLMNAVRTNDFEFVHRLMDKEADSNAQSKKTGRSPIFYAVSHLPEQDDDHFEKATIVDALLTFHKDRNLNANPNLTNIAGQTPLMYAADSGDEALVEQLLKNGAKETINAVDKDGVTALTRAVIGGHEDAARLLLENDAELYPQGQGRWTPISQAYKQENIPMLQILFVYTLEDDNEPDIMAEIETLLRKKNRIQKKYSNQQ